MFEHLPNRQPPKHESYSVPLKGIAISAAGILLSLGLCGAGAMFSGNAHTDKFSGAFLVMGTVVLAISVLGIFISFIALLIALIFQRSRS